MFYSARMDNGWTMAIERNRKPLLRIVATLFAAIGLGEGKAVERLAWPLYRVVLSILIPAESAVRRLIVVAAMNLVATPSPSRPAPEKRKASSTGKAKRNGQGKGRVVFWLFDRRKRFDLVFDPFDQGADAPRLPGFAAPGPKPKGRHLKPPAPAPDGMVKTASLCRRLIAIQAALNDLSAQAKRYARWRATPFERRRQPFTSALRPGNAPGWRRKPTHEVALILDECQDLARYAETLKPDTS